MPWWEAYGLIKHQRSENYNEGNLGNLLNAMAALYYLERFKYREIARNNPETKYLFDVPPDISKLFYIHDFKTKGIELGNQYFYTE